MQNAYVKKGLLYFSDLEKDNIQILTTYDNSTWGNMSPKFAASEQVIVGIAKKDLEIQKILGTKNTIDFTTPIEDTVIDLEKRSMKYLDFIYRNKSEFKSISVKANAGIIYPSGGANSYIFAPRDCPILCIVPPEREFILVIHLGAPQVIQDLHSKIFRLASELINKSDFKNSKVYITPHISGEKYYVTDEKFLMYQDIVGNDINRFTKKKFN